MYKVSIILIFTLLFPNLACSANWSRFITTQNRDDVIISFRQMKINNAWSVEWQVNNNSEQTVEPFLKNRNYLCDDNKTLKFTKTTLGVYLPKSKRHGDLKDNGICPNSKIKLVEIETEIFEVTHVKTRDKTSSN